MKAGLTLSVMLLFAAACVDESRKAAAPTAPSAAVSNQTAPAPAVMSGATVCLSYGRDRELVRAQLRDAPTSEKLQKKLEAFDELILDAC